MRVFLLFLLSLAGCAPSQELADPLSSLKPWHPQPLQPIPPTPSVPKIPTALQQPVTLNIAAPLPLKEILMALAAQTHVPISVTAEVIGQGIISAYEQPLHVVLRQLCETYNLRARWQNGALHLMPDQPYIRTYTLPMLALKRHNKVHTSITGDVINENNRSNTTSHLSAETNNDFWAELNAALDTLLGLRDLPKAPAPKGIIPRYTFHKQAGLLMVNSIHQHHMAVQKYLHQLHQQLTAQVLIEAKVIEVHLSNTYQSGVNWQLFRERLSSHGAHYSTMPSFNALSNTQPDNLFSLRLMGQDISVVVTLLKQFGQIKTLSNPRLTVMNNQPAVLKVARNYVYFTAKHNLYLPKTVLKEGIQPAMISGSESQVHTVPIGLILIVQPALDMDTKDIILSLRPTISAINQLVTDPLVSILSEQKVTSQVPVIEVRELDSVLRLKSGDTAIVGGLMQEQTSSQNQSLPLPTSLFEIFTNTDQQTHKTELIILLRATLIEPPLPPLAPEIAWLEMEETQIAK